MCIICVSPAGVKQPDTAKIRTMFKNNPDGAGYMVARNGKVYIHKGFMNIDDLLDQLHYEGFTDRDPVVYHFRISTQAGVKPQMTHPFPLSNRLEHMEELDLKCSVGIAHNGIIHLTSTGDKNFSDTALFITRFMPYIIRNSADLRDKDRIDAVSELINSKMVFLDKTGYIRTIGKFETENGILFSNNSHSATYKTYTYKSAKNALPWKSGVYSSAYSYDAYTDDYEYSY